MEDIVTATKHITNRYENILDNNIKRFRKLQLVFLNLADNLNSSNYYTTTKKADKLVAESKKVITYNNTATQFSRQPWLNVAKGQLQQLSWDVANTTADYYKAVVDQSNVAIKNATTQLNHDN